MDRRIHRRLLTAAVLLVVAVVAVPVIDALRQARDPVGYAYQQGVAAYDRDDHDTALRHFREALAGAPDDLGIAEAVAATLTRLRRFDEALGVLNLNVNRFPNRADVYASRGNLHELTGTRDSAVADYRRALQIDPNVGAGPVWALRLRGAHGLDQSLVADRLQRLARAARP